VHGVDALAWSFHGTTDGASAQVRDASTFPLLATLHYLVRSNGCARVVESGTFRGISTACIASAVAHRDGGRVVSFDPHHHPERDALFAALHAPIRACIEPRPVDALAGMTAALEAHEV
jgi:predicted O-methyltransferase YrrM